MATIKPGSIVDDIRGSVGDETYGRNQGGIYVKARKAPTYTRTGPQAATRDAIKFLSQIWSSVLTETQRSTWRMYASQHPIPNRWGEAANLSGYNMFIRINSYHYRENSAVGWPTAPSNAPLWPPVFVFTADAVADTITISLPIGGYPLPLEDMVFWLFGGEPQSQGVYFFTSPWKYIGFNTYVSGWLHDPWIVNYPWAFAANNRLFVYIVAQDKTTGALSTQGRNSLLAT